MFIKPFKVKSNVAIKGSDRKKLRQSVLKAWPWLNADDINSLIPNKGEVNVVKLVTHNEDNVIVYTNGSDPIVFQINNQLIPTVYMLWKFPDLLPCLTTHNPVLQRLQSGADLMLPGIVQPYPNQLRVNQLCEVRIESNKAPIAVGKTLLDSHDMYMAAQRGKALSILHVYRDELWAFGSKKKPPDLGPCQDLPNTAVADDFPPLGSSQAEVAVQSSLSEIDFPPLSGESTKDIKSDDLQPSDDSIAAPDQENEPEIDVASWDLTEDDEISPELTMEELIRKSFLTALKTSAKKLDLPILTSNFYRLHMIPACSETIDIKKSKYKKLSKFLQEMREQGIVEIKEQSKGVESITSINRDHPMLASFRVDKDDILPVNVPPVEESSQHYVPPDVKEVYCITAAVLPLFAPFGFSKGDPLTGAEVRRYITEYVAMHQLQNPSNKKVVKLDPHLSCVLKKNELQDSMSWVDLLNRIPNQMTLAYIISHQDEPAVLRKGTLPNINFSIQSRAGNKKMTMVTGVDAWGMDLQAVAKTIQTGVASSAGVTTTNENQVALQVQGDQRKYLSVLFLDKFKIPRKYLKGLDALPQTKGKKK